MSASPDGCVSPEGYAATGGGGITGTVGSGVNGEAAAMAGGGGITGTVGSGVNGEAAAMAGGGGITGTVGSGVNGEATAELRAVTNTAATRMDRTLSDLVVIDTKLPWAELRIKIVPLKLYKIYNKSNFVGKGPIFPHLFTLNPQTSGRKNRKLVYTEVQMTRKGQGEVSYSERNCFEMRAKR